MYYHPHLANLPNQNEQPYFKMSKTKNSNKNNLLLVAIGFIAGWLFVQYAYIPLKQMLLSWF